LSLQILAAAPLDTVEALQVEGHVGLRTLLFCGGWRSQCRHDPPHGGAG